LAALALMANEEIAQRLRDLRASRGNPPQTAVAAAMGVGHRTYQTWENGEARPNYNGLKRAARYYGVSVDYITEGVVDAPPENDSTQLDRIELMLQEVLSRLPERDADGLAATPPPGPPTHPAKRPARRPSRAA
jgi:transcriptional regulator with XRE-family HTH domain